MTQLKKIDDQNAAVRISDLARARNVKSNFVAIGTALAIMVGLGFYAILSL